VGDVNARLRSRERPQVAPPQAPATSEPAQQDGERAVDRTPWLAPDHLAQARTLRAADLEGQVGPSRVRSRAFAFADVLVADVDAAQEGHFVVDE
jgi:hypothetical protein